MIRSTTTRVAVTVTVTGLALAVAGCDVQPNSTGETTSTGDEALDALIEEAQAEGEVNLYIVPDERVAQQIQEDFQDQFGVTLNYTRATAAEIAQRFSAEADAGATVADVVISLNDGFLADQLENGNISPIEELDIPGYPFDLVDEAQMDGLALVQLTRLAIGYNSDEVAEGEIEGWEDLLDPSLNGKIALSSLDNKIHLDLMYVLSEEYGMEYLEELSGQVQRVYQGGSQVVEALSSTEAHAAIGVVVAGLEIAAAEGAPLGHVIPENTVLSPSVMGVVADAPHPAAAKLLAYYLVTDGLDLLNAADGQVPPTDSDAFDVGYLGTPELDAEAAEHKAEILEALGIE